MTYCVGWILGESAFLAADTAATSARPPRKPQSSIGELHDKVRGFYVEESVLKIVPIGEGMAAAFAGDANLCHAIALFLSQNFSQAESIATLVQSMVASIGPFAKLAEVSLIIARSSIDGNPELYRWTSRQLKLESGSSFYSIGSMETYLDYTPTIASVLETMNASGHRALTTMTALLQSFGVRDVMIQQNIGGAIFGLMSHGGAIEWQRDTAVIIYADDFLETIRVKLAVIDNGLVISSSASKETKAFLTLADGNSWLTEHRGEVERRIHDEQPRQWVFLHSQRWLITIVDGEPGSGYPATDYASIGPDESEGTKLFVGSGLLEMLRRHFPGPSRHPYFYFVP